MRSSQLFVLSIILFCSSTGASSSPLLRTTPVWKGTTTQAVRRPGHTSLYGRRMSGSRARNSDTIYYASRKKSQPVQTLEEANPEIPTFQELGPVGKVVVGSVQVAMTVVVEYATGFLGGYILGSIAGVPGLFTRVGPTPVENELSKRLGRWNGKAVRWATTWAPISAVYGGCDAAVRVARGNVKDQWNTVFSSAAAGAYFNRKGGPQAMLQGAVIYGGITYILSGGMGSQRQQFEYKEEALEF